MFPYLHPHSLEQSLSMALTLNSSAWPTQNISKRNVYNNTNFVAVVEELPLTCLTATAKQQPQRRPKLGTEGKMLPVLATVSGPQGLSPVSGRQGSRRLHTVGVWQGGHNNR